MITALGVFKRSAIPFMLKHLVIGSITWNLIEELPQFTTRMLLFFNKDFAVLAAAIFRTLKFVVIMRAKITRIIRMTDDPYPTKLD